MPDFLVRCSTKTVAVGRTKRITAVDINDAIAQARVIQRERGAASAIVRPVLK